MPDNIRRRAPESVFFKGRPNDPRLGEWVRPIDSTELPPTDKRQAVVIFGSPDDQGVLLNRGRAGAKDGPDSTRKYLYKMTPPMDFEWEAAIVLFDRGNIIPVDSILETHRRAFEMSKNIAASGATLIALGGGHDFAAPHFLGFVDGRTHKDTGVALINVDPHLDVREFENDRPSSGTPFRQILESGKLPGKNLIQFGTCRNRNSRPHFEYCKGKKVTIVDLESIRKARKPVDELYSQHLGKLAKRCARLGTTFDMDACYETDGVSAAPVIGFSAWEMVRMAAVAGTQGKVKFLEIAEAAPSLDFNERSSRIAAEMIHAFLTARGRAL